MAGNTRTFAPVLGKRIRMTVLDECGNVPAPGTSKSQIASSGFITVSLTAEVEEGAEIITKRADGSLCVNEKFADSFKRFTMEMEFCGVHPALLSIGTNAKEYLDYFDDVAGFTVGEGAIDNKFSFELWTGLSGQACVPGQETASGYMLLPFLNAGIVGDLEIGGEDAVSFSMTGAYTKGGNGWGVGPYKVLQNDAATPVAAPLPTPLDALDHLLMIDTAIAPPPESDSLAAMPAA